MHLWNYEIEGKLMKSVGVSERKVTPTTPNLPETAPKDSNPFTN